MRGVLPCEPDQLARGALRLRASQKDLHVLLRDCGPEGKGGEPPSAKGRLARRGGRCCPTRGGHRVNGLVQAAGSTGELGIAAAHEVRVRAQDAGVPP